MHRRRLAALLAAVFLFACGCGTAPAAPPPADDRPYYEAPPFHDASFHPELAVGTETVRIDISAVAEGYVGVSATSDARLKFQVRCGEDVYNYDLASDGTPSVFPLSSGDGDYRFRVMKNIAESRYAEEYAVDCTVKLADPFQPFLRPSDYVSYSAGSACVRKAEELTQTAHSETEVVEAIYGFICQNIRYDKAKASSVQSGYLPDPDETLATGKGICFDYAALAAAMLRSRGIPTKEVLGYVSPDGLYHAWNMFYTTETGWVTVKFTADGSGWIRMDSTFGAGGTDQKFIGDGNNYADLYYY